MWVLSNRSKRRLEGVHPDLVGVIEEAISKSPYDFGVSEGVRSKERQAQLVASGKSRTMHSRHLTGHAVDVFVLKDGEVTWEFPYYHAVADHIKAVAKLRGVDILWGGDWKSFRDGPHFELNRKSYT